MPSIQPLAFLTVRMSVKDAEAFIKTSLESDIRGNNNIFVRVEPEIKQLELFACLKATHNAFVSCLAPCSPKIAAIKALREAAKDRGLDIGLADAKAVVEAFIEV